MTHLDAAYESWDDLMRDASCIFKERNDRILANLDSYPPDTTVVHPQIGITSVGNLIAYRQYTRTK